METTHNDFKMIVLISELIGNLSRGLKTDKDWELVASLWLGVYESEEFKNLPQDVVDKYNKVLRESKGMEEQAYFLKEYFANRVQPEVSQPSELLPCFCGGKAEKLLKGNNHTKKKSVVIKCASCSMKLEIGARIYSLEWCDKEATEAWNKRANRERRTG